MALSEHLTDQLEIDFSKLDDLIKPQRIAYGDAVSVRASLDTGEGTTLEADAEIVSISPIGLLLTFEDSDIDLLLGQNLTIELRVGNQTIQNNIVVVSKASEGTGTTGYATRIVVSDAPQTSSSHDRRRTPRWICNEQFYPTAIAANPGKYNDYMYFSLRDLSKQGARAVTSLRNKFIVKGMQLELLVSLPMVSQISLNATITNVNIASEKGKDLLTVGFEFSEASTADHQSIAQYLLQFADSVSLESLRSEGLVPESVARAINFSFVRTADELKEVVELRKATYSAAGKENAEFHSDPYDARAKIVIGKYKDQIVTSCRVFFPEESEILEQEQYIQLPTSIGRRDQTAEIMRVCTHPHFRRGDLLLSLFKFLAITCVQAKRFRIVGCAEPHLLKIYTKVGFQDLGLEYTHKELGNTVHRPIFVDARECLLGQGVNPIVWNVVWKDTESYLSRSGMLPATPQAITRTNLYRLASPISKILQSRMNKPRRQ